MGSRSISLAAIGSHTKDSGSGELPRGSGNNLPKCLASCEGLESILVRDGESVWCVEGAGCSSRECGWPPEPCWTEDGSNSACSALSGWRSPCP